MSLGIDKHLGKGIEGLYADYDYATRLVCGIKILIAEVFCSRAFYRLRYPAALEPKWP